MNKDSFKKMGRFYLAFSFNLLRRKVGNTFYLYYAIL